MIFNKLFKFSILICSYALSPFLFILIKVAKPFVLIRITPILSNRYGHLVINPEIYLIEKKKNTKKKVFRYFLYCKVWSM